MIMVSFSEQHTYYNGKRGQSILEILFAITIFTIGVATIGYLIIDVQSALRQGKEEIAALLLAEEGLEAARSIRNNDFDDLAPGTHGLVLSGNTWTFSGANDSVGKFTRDIVITDIDNETKKIESNVSWSITPTRLSTTTLISYLSDWAQTEGDAEYLAVDGSGHTLLLGTTLNGISLQNIGEDSITLTSMRLQWDNAETLHNITIGIVPVFASIPGVSSGTDIDIADYTFLTSIPTDTELVFGGDMTGADLLMTFTFSDGSEIHALIEDL